MLNFWKIEGGGGKRALRKDCLLHLKAIPLKNKRSLSCLRESRQSRDFDSDDDSDEVYIDITSGAMERIIILLVWKETWM